MPWGLSKGHEGQISLGTSCHWMPNKSMGGRDEWHRFTWYLEVNTNNQNPQTLPEKYTKHHALYVWVKSDMVKAKGT